MSRACERGSATVEMVLLAPVLMCLVMFVVQVHRLTDASFRVARAADVGARSASMSSAGNMKSNGIRAARADITAGSPVCAGFGVTSETRPVGRFTAVSVTVWCRTNSRGLGLLGVRGVRITRTSTEVVDYYTGR